MKNLPLGMSTLSTLRNNDCIYVDKTEFALQLIQLPGAYFLSRPRRFGKSLCVDTLKEIFEGHQGLFEGLYIHDHWDWSRRFPVIKIDFAGGVIASRHELDEKIREILVRNGERLQVATGEVSLSGMFTDLISGAVRQYGRKAVVLVDEYDKPMLDAIDKPEVAAEIREGLKNLYSVLKEQDANLQFVFMTGVSKFSRVSLFSGINQLTDITLDARYSALCGYTGQDLRRCFGEHLAGVDWDELKLWYNGYSWGGEVRVYNPFDILQFIAKGLDYRNYWFETGSPRFLIKLFRKACYFLPSLEGIETSEEILDSFDVERINPVTLLFQTGYLTIQAIHTRMRRKIYTLSPPNYEVRAALNDQFINAYTDLVNEKLGLQQQIYSALQQGNLPVLSGVIKRLFAAIPWRNFTHSDLPHFEGYYASVLYAFFASLDATIIPEDISCFGQADLTVIMGDQVYVMEFKLVDDTAIENNPALEQIIARQYAEKYRRQTGQRVHELGLVFSRTQRGLIKADWRTDTINPCPGLNG